MPLDPSLILQTRPVQTPNAQDLVQLNNLRTAGQTSRLQLNQAERAAAGQRTLADLYRSNTNSDGSINSGAISKGLADAGYGDQIPGIQKQAQDMEAGRIENQGKQLALHKQRLDVVNQQLSALLADPELTHDKVIGRISALVDQGIISNEQGAQMVRTLPGPNQLKQFLMGKAIETMDATKQIELMLPKTNNIDTGGEINLGTVDPLTGARTERGKLDKSATPGEKLTNQRLGAGGVSLSPAAIDLAAQRLLNGEPANKVLANFGRGAQGARDIAAVQNRFAQLASASDADATEIALRNQELTSEARTRLELGAREGKIAPRVQEALNFANIAKEFSSKVERGNFVPWNRLKQLTDTQLSDPNLAAMKAATLSLINAYAAAVGGGNPTVHDKEEAEKVLSNAQSPEAYNAVVDQLIRETQAALASPRDVMKDMRKHTRENANERNATPSGATVSNW